jgi:hypothetical protein
MTKRILSAAAAAAAALALLPAGAFAADLAQTSSVDALRSVPRTQGELVAAYSPGTVGAMNAATASVAASEAEAQRQGGRLTAGAVRWTAARQPGS